MKKIIIVLYFFLLITGCSYYLNKQKENDKKEFKDTFGLWIGHDQKMLVQTWGEPLLLYTDGYRNFLVYLRPFDKTFFSEGVQPYQENKHMPKILRQPNYNPHVTSSYGGGSVTYTFSCLVVYESVNNSIVNIQYEADKKYCVLPNKSFWSRLWNVMLGKQYPDRE